MANQSQNSPDIHQIALVHALLFFSHIIDVHILSFVFADMNIKHAHLVNVKFETES